MEEEAIVLPELCHRTSADASPAPAGGARRQSSSSALGVQSLSPPCRGSIWTSERQGQSSFPPILLNHGRDKPHYESLFVV